MNTLVLNMKRVPIWWVARIGTKLVITGGVNYICGRPATGISITEILK